MDQALLVRYMVQQIRGLLSFMRLIPLCFGYSFFMMQEQIHERLVVNL